VRVGVFIPVLAALLALSAALALPPAAQPPAPAPASAPAPAPEPITLPDIPREFRGVWVATVANIDWPSSPNLTFSQQIAEMDAILDTAQRLNLGAVILQVRPSADAMYRSSLEPWSEFLSGRQGHPVEGAPADYDPLERWVAGAHARGLQLHAWFNPFRSRHVEAKGPDAPSHVNIARPDLVVDYARFKWMPPSSAEAREIALRVIEDVTRRYDIDGVHVDDYFYPYPEGRAPFPDQHHYDAYVREARAAKQPVLPRSDWRRAHVDAFVFDLYRRVKAIKPEVLVGVSPFGIWRPGVPAGVDGFDAYEHLAADARRWLNEGWMDYCVPQLYWLTDAPKQPFVPLLSWWQGENRRARHLWPGLNASRVGVAEGSRPGWSPAEITRQIDLSRRAGTRGVVLYSVVALRQAARGLDAAVAPVFAAPSLPPESPWLAGDAPRPAPPIIVLGHVLPSARASAVVAYIRDAAGNWSYAILPRRGGQLPRVAPGGSLWAAEVDRFGRIGFATKVTGP
jgi:uncharacterized lipoprotein YddW (UPF0748 family)